MANTTAPTPTPAATTTTVTTSENAQPMSYENTLGGSEATAQHVVDASNVTGANQAPLNVAGQSAPFAGQDILDPAHMMNNLNVSSGMPMQSPTNAAAPALNAGEHVDTSVAALHLDKPVAGHTETVSVQPGQTVATTFDPNSADLHMQGQNLVMQFHDGSKIVLDHFAADTHNLPTIELPNGALVAGGIIVAQLEGSDANVFNLQTAAGGTDAGGGQFQYSDDFGSVIGLLNKLPPIGFTALTFGQPEPRVVTSNALVASVVADNVGGTFTTTITTIITPPTGGTPGTPGNPPAGTNPDLGGLLGPVSGGFEDWQPYKNIGDHTEAPMALQISFTPSDNEVVDTVTISNFQTGTQFFFGTAGNYTLITPNADGSITFTGAQLASNNVFLLPPSHSDKDIPMTISLNIHDPDNGLTAVVAQNTVAIVDAVADLPTTTSSISIGAAHDDANHLISAGEHTPIVLNVSAAFADNDGSETHTIILSGVPHDWVPTGGTLVVGGLTFVATTAADGTTTYTATVTGNVSGTVTFDPQDWSSKNGDAHLVLTVRTAENVTDGELTTANNVAEVTTPFTVHIVEDVPTLVSTSGPVSISEDALLVPGVDAVNGQIVVDNHHDTPGVVKLTTDGLTALNLTSHGQALSYALSADGKTITATDTSGHTVFTVTLNADTTSGTQQTTPYTFTLSQALDHPTGNGANIIDIPVKFTATDSDGDSISGTVHMNVVDGLPTIGTSEVSTDETNPLGATISGTVNVHFGPDGAGTVAATQTFTSSGSQLNGTLTSHGVAVVVTYENGHYIGKAGATTVFTMTINADGTYNFVQSAVLDHADGHNANDVINLNFGYTAKDFDGDTATGNVVVHVVDDAPVAANDTNFIPNGSLIATGNLLTNDTLSHDAPTLVQSATVNGVTKDFAHADGTDAHGSFINLTGTYGTLHLYQDGSYTYTYDTANHNGNLVEKFDYTIVDYDGDTSSTANNSGLVITITDNGPGSAPSVVTSIDETDLTSTVTGHAISGAITPAAPLHDYSLTSAFGSSGSETAGHLTSHGIAVTTVAITGPNGIEIDGQANGAIVFTLILKNDGTYTFTQYATLDHADGNNPNDVIDLNFNYTAKDANGESVPGTITVHVADDAPVAVNDANFVPNGSTVATGNLLTNDTLSHDAPTLVLSATVNGTAKDFAHADGTDANGKYINLVGTYGTLHLYQNGSYTYTYDTANHNGTFTEKFDYTIIDSDGDTSSTANNSGLVITITDNGPGSAPSVVASVDETTLGTGVSGTINPAAPLHNYALVAGVADSGSELGGHLTSHGVAVTTALVGNQYIGTANGVTVFTLTLNANGSYTFVQSAVVDHADGANPNDVIDLKFNYSAQDANNETVPGVITVHISDDAPIAVNDTNFIPNGSTVATGNLLANDTLSHDAPTLLQSATINGTTKDFAHADGSDANGAYINLTGTYGTLHLYQNGSYTYTYDTANHNGTFTEKFDYTIVDFDGDTSSTANNSGLVITITDNGPGTAPSIEATVDETTLGTAVSGTITPAAPLHDYALSGSGFAASGSETAGHLTSHGVAVTVALVGNQYIGTANGVTVFTMTLNANGTYNFVQTAVLDHADDSNPNDVIDLKFNYSAHDANNESVAGTVTVHVRDDAPVAVADTNAIQNGGNVATGNVIANDILSHDAPNVLQSVSFAGTTVSFANPSGSDANGKFINLTGTYGTIHIYENGNYTYTYDTAHNTGNHTEQFGYTLVDYDGDTSSTSGQVAGQGLTITIVDGAPTASPTFVGVDETDTLSHVFTGSFNSSFGPDGAGTVAANNSFNATGSLLNSALTSHGVAVTVALANGTYTGTANGVTIFTLTVNANGTYSFEQFHALDHADGHNINDAIDLNFGYQVTDHDGDTASSTITVRVLDDAPIAIADTNAIQNGGTVATGNVIANDVLSHDAPNVLQSVSFAGTTVSFTNPSGSDANGKFINLTGTYGTIHIYENGSYTYTYDTAHHSGTNVEQFGYTIVDYDGDTSFTSGQINGQGLTITIVDNGPGTAPTLTTTVDETTLGTPGTGTITVPDATTITPGGGSVSTDTTLTSHGVPVVITIIGNQYVGTANGTPVFTLTITPDGHYNFTQTGTLDHPDSHNPNDTITITFPYTATDGDGDGSIGSVVVHINDDAPIAVADNNSVPDTGTIANGNVITNDTLSHDNPNTIQSVTFGGTTKTFAAPDGTDANGKYILVTGTYGTIKMHENGEYTYTFDKSQHSGDHMETFTYTLQDSDGDTSSTTLSIDIVDHGPGAAPTVTGQVDETNLNTAIGGTITVPGASSYALTAGFSSDGSQLNSALTSHGVPVTVTLNGNQYVGMANGVLVFTLTLNNDGTYNFVQKATLDHADGNNPNDAINLNFSYLASDSDGDTSLGHVVVSVLDDAPIAIADLNNTLADGGATTGASTTGNVLSNDTLSHDTPNTIQSVGLVGGAAHDFSHADGTDAGGKYVLVNGNYGQIKIYDNGQYTYTYTDNSHTGNHTEQFTYNLVDSDGDHSSTTLTINIVDTYNAPPTLSITGSSNNDSIFGIDKLTVPFGTLPTLYELNNINCTPAEFATLTQNASNMLNLSFPTVLTIDIQSSIQQSHSTDSLGAFMVDSSGHISNVQVLLGAAGGSTTEATYDTSGGTGKVVFFIIPNGSSALQALGLASANGSAVHSDSTTLSMQQQADGSVKLVYTDASGSHTLSNTIYASDPSYNNDGQSHAVAGTYSTTPEGTAIYAFEDASGPYSFYGSDRDFNDVVFSVSAQPLVTAHYDNSHVLFSTLNITDNDSVAMHEALVEVRNPHAGDILSFDFTGTAYSMNGDHVYKNGVDTGITATFTTSASGALDAHLVGDSATSTYNDVLKALHFNSGGDPLSSNGVRTVDVTITDDHHQSSTLTTTYNVNMSVDGSLTTAAPGGSTIVGTAHNDVLVGREGNDTLNGGAGHDTLIGGSGTNTLTGGTGADSFMFLHGTSGISTITDYHKAEGDRIDIRDLLTNSSYTPGVSHVQDYVKIDHTTGSVFVDATGHGNFTEANHIATIANISTVDTVNILLNEHEGNKVVHTV